MDVHRAARRVQARPVRRGRGTGQPADRRLAFGRRAARLRRGGGRGAALLAAACGLSGHPSVGVDRDDEPVRRVPGGGRAAREMGDRRRRARSDGRARLVRDVRARRRRQCVGVPGRRPTVDSQRGRARRAALPRPGAGPLERLAGRRVQSLDGLRVPAGRCRARPGAHAVGELPHRAVRLRRQGLGTFDSTRSGSAARGTSSSGSRRSESGAKEMPCPPRQRSGDDVDPGPTHSESEPEPESEPEAESESESESESEPEPEPEPESASSSEPTASGRSQTGREPRCCRNRVSATALRRRSPVRSGSAGSGSTTASRSRMVSSAPRNRLRL